MTIAIIVFVLAQLGDVITTKRALSQSGKREANPFMRVLFDRLGVNGGLAVKVLVASALVYWLWSEGAALPIWAVAVMTGAVALHNHRLMQKG
ncbi:DUF5658 family protein [Phaeobacter sp. JH20_36]|uniref:DUF5658 family protein n=1 Tax=unclassified Phaeobacter TaxID=2621772 RepID=UPI003A84CB95